MRSHLGRTKLLAAALALAGSTVVAAPAQADANPYQRGPDPTEASVTDAKGPFATATVTVPAGGGRGFNDGVITYPTDQSQGTFGAIAVMPGFVSPEGAIEWYGQRLASQGFVVLTLDSDNPFDLPGARKDQLLASLDYLITKSPMKDRIDPSRLAVMGWSMGGGGTIEAAAQRPALKAAVGLAPWDISPPLGSVTTPTMLIADDTDVLAPTGLMAKPFYDGMSKARDKAFFELKNADHFTFTTPNDTIAKYVISWMKRFVDNDTRYDQFLCPTPTGNPAITQFLDTCPLK
ncbi:dienelactone hydrolase family protein [Actinomadura gamaensis]|uniref:Poly(ethylene terephthalate) hydrolase n=1 Tax=Actinomadura gamaensis TaxID=1763541 RepID=A0ABV9U3N1_9ACTN